MFFHTYHSPLPLDPSKTWASKQISAGQKMNRIGERRIQFRKAEKHSNKSLGDVVVEPPIFFQK